MVRIEKMKNRNLTFRYCAVQGFLWMNYAVIMGFSSVYLLDTGYTSSQIGIIIAIAGIFSAILQPMIAGYADKPESISVKKIVMILAVCQIVFGGLLILTFHRSMILTGLLYGCGVMVLQLLTPFVNSLGMESINQGKMLNFGIGRGMGSAAYAVMAYALGIVVGRTSPLLVPIAMTAAFAGFLTALILFPFEKVRRKKQYVMGKENPIVFFAHYKRFAVLLIGCICVYICNVLLSSFTFQIVKSKGGSSGEMGFSMALAAFLEIPTMFLFSRMVKKIRCDIWFRIAGIFFTAKTVGTLLVQTLSGFYAVQILQMLGWGLMTVVTVYYVNAIMDERDVIKGQAYMTMTYTIGSVVGALLGGALIDVAGVGAMLVFAAVSAGLGTVIIFCSVEKVHLK